jgi:hypothetical protein
VAAANPVKYNKIQMYLLQILNCSTDLLSSVQLPLLLEPLLLPAGQLQKLFSRHIEHFHKFLVVEARLDKKKKSAKITRGT